MYQNVQLFTAARIFIQQANMMIDNIKQYKPNQIKQLECRKNVRSSLQI